jgi:hypothetical protein
VKTSSPWARDCVLTMCLPTSGVSAILHENFRENHVTEEKLVTTQVPLSTNAVTSVLYGRGQEGPNWILSGQGETDSCFKNLKLKIFCQTPFKENKWEM